MGLDLAQYEEKSKDSVKAFWGNREAAKQKKLEAGKVDQGTRGLVTAGENMDGFVALMIDIVEANGLQDAMVMRKKGVLTLPGYFRPTKLWDLLIIHEGRLIAALEMKSMVGSYGKNFNNRTEEVIGAAHDLWVAYREGAFGHSPKPFLGWLMLVCDEPKARKPVKSRSPHFPLFPEFENACYLDRYNILCRKLVREQLYTSAAVIASKPTAKETGEYSELDSLTGLKSFLATFAGHIAAEAARTQ